MKPRETPRLYTPAKRDQSTFKLLFYIQRTLSIVTRPGDRVRDRRVDAHRAQEDARIARTGGLTAQQHGKAGNAEDGHGDVTDTTLTCAIRNEANGHGQNSCRSVGGYAQELTPDRAVACEVLVQHIPPRCPSKKKKKEGKKKR